MKDEYREFFNNRFFHGDETMLWLPYKQFFVTSQSCLLSIDNENDNEKVYKIFLTCGTSKISPLSWKNVERKNYLVRQIY